MKEETEGKCCSGGLCSCSASCNCNCSQCVC